MMIMEVEENQGKEEEEGERSNRSRVVFRKTRWWGESGGRVTKSRKKVRTGRREGKE